MEIYLFNPEHDLALANGTPLYTPTPTAKALRRDLRLLPMWYAPAGSYVLGEEEDREWLARMDREHGLGVELVTKKELRGMSDAVIRPWGWNHALRKELIKAGLAESCLKTPEELDKIRELSHRRLTVKFHQRLREMPGIGEMPPEPIEATTIDEVRQYVNSHPYCFIKKPYSGSGRGVYRTYEGFNRPMEQWCVGALREQGSVMCEPGYGKMMDFAVEYDCRNGKPNLIGLSVFMTDMHNQYKRGFVAHDRLLQALIMRQEVEVAAAIVATQKPVAEELCPYYDGYVGVDMMLYADQTTGLTKVNPCVEVNVRATMGVVTCGLAEKFKVRDMREFKIISPADLTGDETQLTPVYADTSYVAVMM